MSLGRLAQAFGRVTSSGSSNSLTRRGLHRQSYDKLKSSRQAYAPREFNRTIRPQTDLENYLRPKTANLASPASPEVILQAAPEDTLESHWKLHSLQQSIQAFLQMPQTHVVEVESFVTSIDLSEHIPTTDLVNQLVAVCCQYQLFDRAVGFYAWARDHGVFLRVEFVLRILHQTRGREGWDLIRSRLKQDLDEYYQDQLEAVNKSEEFMRTRDFSHFHPQEVSLGAIRTGSATASQVASSAEEAAEQSSQSKVDWINFVSDPLAHRGEEVEAYHHREQPLVKKLDEEKNDILKKHTGFPLGDRQKRLSKEMKQFSTAELQALAITDSVVLSTVIDELLSRGLVDSAIQRLDEVMQQGSVLINSASFHVLAAHYRDTSNVDGILELLKMMMQQNVEPDIAFLNTLMDIHVSLGNYRHAYQIFAKLPTYNVKANATTISVMMQMMATLAEKKERLPMPIETLLAYAQDRNLHLGDAVLTHLLHFAVQMHMFDFAVKVWKLITSPNANAHHDMLELYVERPQSFNRFLDTYYDMEHAGIALTEHGLKLVRRATYMVGRPDLFMTIMQYQRTKHGLMPDLDFIKVSAVKALKYGYVGHVLQLELFRVSYLKDVAIPRKYLDVFINNRYFWAVCTPIFKNPYDKETGTWAAPLSKREEEELALIRKQQGAVDVRESRLASPEYLQAWNKAVHYYISNFDLQAEIKLRQLCHKELEAARRLHQSKPDTVPIPAKSDISAGRSYVSYRKSSLH